MAPAQVGFTWYRCRHFLLMENLHILLILHQMAKMNDTKETIWKKTSYVPYKQKTLEDKWHKKLAHLLLNIRSLLLGVLNFFYAHPHETTLVPLAPSFNAIKI